MRDWVVGIVFTLLGGLIVLGVICVSPPKPPLDVRDSVTLTECQENVDWHIRLGREKPRTIRSWYAWCADNMPDSPRYRR